MSAETLTYPMWCAARGVTHGHCGGEYPCEHPQPFAVVLTGETAARLICGRCWVRDGIVTECVPCDEETCK